MGGLGHAGKTRSLQPITPPGLAPGGGFAQVPSPTGVGAGGDAGSLPLNTKVSGSKREPSRPRGSPRGAARAPEPISRASSIAPPGGSRAAPGRSRHPAARVPMGGVRYPGGFPSGQRGQTVNLMALPSQVRILLRPPPVTPGSVAAPQRNRLGGTTRPSGCGVDARWGRGGVRFDRSIDGPKLPPQGGVAIGFWTDRREARVVHLRGQHLHPVRIESRAVGSDARPTQPGAENTAARACAGVVQW